MIMRQFYCLEVSCFYNKIIMTRQNWIKLENQLFLFHKVKMGSINSLLFFATWQTTFLQTVKLLELESTMNNLIFILRLE